MRKYIGRIYVDYFFFNIWAISLTCVALASVIFKLIGFEEVFGVDIYIILWIILQAVDKCRNCMSQQPILMRKSAENVII